MKILIISTVKPYDGSGSGLTDYAYQLIKHMKPLLKKGGSIEELYALEKAKKNNISGLVRVNTAFKRKVAAVPRDKYDIIHIADQEIGFAAKVLKKARNKAKIVTTIHDLARFEKNLHRGFAQKVYNKLIRGSTVDVIKYSDIILCNSSQTYETIERRFHNPKNLKVVLHGVDDKFIKIKNYRKQEGRDKFVVGYIGALAYHKNVVFILKVAEKMKDDSRYMFEIYGKGPELRNLMKFKERHLLNNVKFIGYINEKEKIRMYDNFDAFMFPSLYEGLGLPVLEAHARGLPVIVYKNSSLPKEVKELCISVKDPIEAAHVVSLVMKRRKRASARTVEMRQMKEFTWSKTAKKTLEIYKRKQINMNL